MPGKYWNGEPNAGLMRKEITHLRHELAKECRRIDFLEKLATRSMTGVTITHIRSCDSDDGCSGFYLMAIRRRYGKRSSLRSAIDITDPQNELSE